MTDLRVIYLVHPSKGVPAPELPVRFYCEECDGYAVLDAYQGPPVCQIHRRVMEGIAVIRPPQPRHEPTPLNPDVYLGVERDKGASSREVTEELDAMFEEHTP